MASPLYDFCRDWLARPTVNLINLALEPIGEHVAPVGELATWLDGPGLHVVTTLKVVLVAFMVGMLNLVMMVYAERKIAGRLMDRRGPMLSLASIWLDHNSETAPYLFSGYGFIQNIADGLKLFAKELIVPNKADKILYTIAPVIFISSSVMLVTLVPLSDRFVAFEGQAGILFIMAIFAIAPVGVLTAGWASNNKYSLIGGMRSAAQLMSYEIPLLLSMAGVFLMAGSFNPLDIVAQQQAETWLGIPMWNIVPQFLGFCVFMIAILAEVERVPFDLPEAESELVEGWTTEYGGMRFGLFLAAEYIRGFIGCAVAVILFLGGWAGPNLSVALPLVIEADTFPLQSAELSIPAIVIFGAVALGGLGFLLGPALAKPKASVPNQLKYCFTGGVVGLVAGIAMVGGLYVSFPFMEEPLGLPDIDHLVDELLLPGPEIWFLAKVWILFILFIFIRWTLPRIRTDQILELGWKRLLPAALVNILIVIGLGLGHELFIGGGN